MGCKKRLRQTIVELDAHILRLGMDLAQAEALNLEALAVMKEWRTCSAMDSGTLDVRRWDRFIVARDSLLSKLSETAMSEASWWKPQVSGKVRNLTMANINEMRRILREQGERR